ncbi:hypothetical protein GWI33_000782 [Rhynchophorus ferrugineus]|uniref:RNase H type-1 domain-containing protein n=1 Tax=Rhynchophorus ferrugineus TaxID=354439 RepID=A0A834HLQ8_RHYFE|nr:hypothetical protein GWI33_000782 [Rhynchophorus ferrugineus]
MDNSIVIQVNQLLQSLNQAKRDAIAIEDRIKDIRSEINRLTACTKLLLNNSGSSNSNICYMSKSSAKRLLDCDSESEPKKSKSEVPNENGYVVVYTDGACENNGKANAKAGIGVWFGDGHSLNVSEPVKGRPTNNTAEIQASIAALRIIKDLGYRKVKLFTDSQFTISCITKWIKKWKVNGWKLSTGGAVKNKEDLVVLDGLCQNFDDIKWEYCAGHAGIKGNEAADELARRGAMRYKPS